MRGEPAVELGAEQHVAELGPVVGQHGPVAAPRGGQQLQVHLAAGVHQVSEPGRRRGGVRAGQGRGKWNGEAGWMLQTNTTLRKQGSGAARWLTR